MKRVIQLFFFTCLSTIIAAQTNIWLGPSGNWNETAKWSLNMVPTADHDVVVPAGLVLNINVSATMNSIVVQGPGTTVDINSSMTIDSASLYMAGCVINWSSGSLLGGDTLTNEGQVNLLSNGSKFISGNSIFNNSGEVIFESAGDLFISDGVVNNLVSGGIDMKVDAGNITWSGVGIHQLNNFGTIKKTGPGTSIVICELFNQGGTIQVDSGAIDFENNIGKHLIGGIYNIAAGAILNWEGAIFVSGNLMGTIDGNLNWKTTVNVMDTATFDFNGMGEFNWANSSLEGGGVLVNKSVLNLSTTAAKSIFEDTELVNEGMINVVSAGDLLISQGMLTNNTTGILDLQTTAGNITWAGSGNHLLNNAGTIKRSSSSGDVQILAELHNTGTIQVDTGSLTLTNSIGKYLTGGIYNVAAGAVLNWSGETYPLDTLNGTIDGALNWNNIVEIPVGQMATFNFGGTGSFNWTASNLMGGGTLTNDGVINLTGTGAKFIQDSTQLINTGTINIASAGDLLISQGVVTNTATGTIDLQATSGNISWSGGTVHILNNEGLIIRSTTAGVAQIQVLVNNNGGTFQVDTGSLEFINSIGKNLTSGIYNVAAGAVFNWNGTINPLDTLSGTIDGELNWNSIVEIPTGQMAAFNFGGSGSFNWTASNLTGGGTLSNIGTINLTSTGAKFILDTTALINHGIINIASSGDLLVSDGIVTNEATGIIDLQANAGDISWSGGTIHILNNEGLIKRTMTSGNAQIHVLLNNNGGTIQVDTGSLELTNAIGKNFNGGVINVAAGAVLDWSGVIAPIGTISGTIDGDLNWKNIVNVPMGQIGIFDFGGSGNFNWLSSNLTGGGKLVNAGILKLVNTGGKFIVDDSQLINEGEIQITSSGDLFISQGKLINKPTGIIDLQAVSGNISWSGGTVHEFLNMGLLRCSVLSGIAQVLTSCENSGVIDIVSGELEFGGSLGFTNLASGVIQGTGILDLPPQPYFINAGTISPGASPGKLTIQGDYVSAPSAFLNIELNGLTPDTLYDQIEIQGASDFEGGINLSLNFIPTIGDSFTIVTSTGTLTSNLRRVMSVMYSGTLYNFLVHTENDVIILELAEIGCLSNRVFSGTSFDGLYSASVDIISTNGQVVENTVFNAPLVILNPEFDVPFGKSFEILPYGCP